MKMGDGVSIGSGDDRNIGGCGPHKSGNALNLSRYL
jgi:hypothetical protein